MDARRTLDTLLYAGTGTVGTSAIQISGGPQTGLSNPSAGYVPSKNRQGIRVICLTPGAVIYYDSQSSVTANSYMYEAVIGAPITDWINGWIPRYIIGSQAGISYRIEEYQ